MNSQIDKENSVFGSNIIKIKPFKSRKHKSLETKINKNPFFNISFGQDLNSNEKIKHVLSQEAHTPEFGLNRKNKLSIKGLSKNGHPIRWKQNQRSSNFQLKMHSIDVVTFRPLIQKSNKIPDVFFKAIQHSNKPFKELEDLVQNKGVPLNHQKYLPLVNLRNEKYKVLKNEKIVFKQNPQQTDKFMEHFIERPRQQTNLGLLRNKLRKIL